jgi:hypothetical protein
MILFLAECPTPRHTPVLDELHRLLADDILVVYLTGPDTLRGWGKVTIQH